jgi:uncharacterized cupredoxin-like copper-binding protein
VAAVVSAGVGISYAIPAPGSGATDNVVPVELSNFKVVSPMQIRAGAVRFDIDGKGPTMHEFNVARIDHLGAPLPVAKDGNLDDESETAEFTHLAEREGVDIGQHASLSVELTPGVYVLYCNMDGHFQAGMWTEVSVS